MKPIFSSNADFTKSAFLNWRISKYRDILNMQSLANGFLLSAIDLTKRCLDNNQHKEADILIFPILTNAHHGIELYLKAITFTINQLKGSESKFEGTHNLKTLFVNVKNLIKEYGGGLSLEDFEQTTKELANYIEELVAKIQPIGKQDKMDFSRYPFSHKYENYFYVNEYENVEIDLENLLAYVEIIHENIEKVFDYLYHFELSAMKNNF
jgi:hypothetical protein